MLVPRPLPDFPMNLMVTATAAVLAQFHSGGVIAPVLDRRVVAFPAVGALQSDDLPGVGRFTCHQITPEGG
jgi:hypothetical protein